MKKPIVLGLILMASLMLLTVPSALSYIEGPSVDWYYVDASSGGYQISVPLVIAINGNASSGQIFVIGDTITITGDRHACAVSSAGAGNGAYTNTTLNVNGPSGPDSDSEILFVWDDVSAAEVNTTTQLTVTYTLTTAGPHAISMNSYASIYTYWGEESQGGVVVEDTVVASLTFEVRVPTKAEVLQGNGVPGKGIDRAPGLQKAVPNDNFAKGTAKETVDATLPLEVEVKKADVLKGNGVPGKGIDRAPGLQKAVPNDNFAEGTSK